jgi:predicted acylesterase/phospholipase RssA
MSGAISAGAYTAGVFDYLIQALDEWEKAVAGVDPDAVHSLGLKVLTGASAGAITAAIGALALADGERKLHVFEDAKSQKFPYYLPKLYEAWVVRPTLVDETGGDNDLLSVSDLRWCNILSVNWLLPSLR